MNYLDLFSGIGGFALGAYMAGMRFDNHFYSEIDKYCVELYKKRFPDSVFLGDITKIDFKKLPEGEWIITGGFPCQDISIAGKGAGIEGKRSGLWFEYWRAIRILRPRFAIIENVGAITFRGLNRVISSLAEIGYDAEWQDIRAEDVGAPHRRERIWIMAYSRYRRGGDKQIIETRIEQKEKRTTNTNQTNRSSYDDNTGYGTGKTCRERQEEAEIQGSIPNSSIKRLEREKSEREQPGKQGLFTECNNELSDSDKTRLQKKRPEQQTTGTARKSTYRKQWSTEPDLGRLVNGISNILDNNIRRLYGENVDNKKAIAKITSYYESTLRNMQNKISNSQTPLRKKSGFNYSLVSEMPYRITYEEWNLGTWIEKDKELCNMWQIICTTSQQEAQNMLKEMSIRIRENQRKQKMASRRVDQLKGLGNAIVPQIAKLLFEQIKVFI